QVTARNRAASHAGVARRVLAGIATAVALIERTHVAIGGARRAARLLVVWRTCRVAAIAGLRHVAFTGRGATECAAIARRMLAQIESAVALVKRARIGVRRTRRAVWLLRIRGTREARAIARLTHVAYP